MFRKKVQQLKYAGKEINHTPDTLREIPSGVLNRISKTTSRKPSINSEGVDKIYPNHLNALRKAGLAPPNLPKMGDLWSKQDERADTEKGDFQFGVFRKKGQQLKYTKKVITHTTGTLRAIPSGVLNRLAKLTSGKPSIHSDGVDKIYPNHANALCKADLTPHNLLTMEDLWSKQDERSDIEK